MQKRARRMDKRANADLRVDWQTTGGTNLREMTEIRVHEFEARSCRNQATLFSGPGTTGAPALHTGD